MAVTESPSSPKAQGDSFLTKIMNVGKAIKHFRKAKKVSQKDLAIITGISQTMISQIESSPNRPTDEVIVKIANALSVTPMLIYLSSAEEHDVPEGKKEMFRKLYPTALKLVTEIFE